MTLGRIELIPVEGMPDVHPGDVLAELIALRAPLEDGDVVVVTQKVVSKAEGQLVAIDPDDNVLFVRQWRTAADRAMLEIPAGTLDRVDPASTIEDPELAAPRELEEETGYRAGSWRKLAMFWTAPGFASELMHLYLATDLWPAHGDRLGPDEDERLELTRLPFARALAAVDRGEICDAKSIVGLFWVDRLRAAGRA